MLALRQFSLRFPLRNAMRMATPYPPKEPLVAIMGTTGTGKSDVCYFLITHLFT